MTSDNTPAVDREALVEAIRPYVHSHSERIAGNAVDAILAASGILLDADEVCDEYYATAIKPVLAATRESARAEGRAELRAVIETPFRKLDEDAPIHYFDCDLLSGGGHFVPLKCDCTAATDLAALRALVADDGAAALREVRRDWLNAVDKCLFGTEDGEYVHPEAELPVGSLRQLLWEFYDTDGEAAE